MIWSRKMGIINDLLCIAFTERTMDILGREVVVYER